MLKPRSTSASLVRSRAVDPASVATLFVLPCAITVAAFVLIPSRTDGALQSERWRPTIERDVPAVVPVIRAAQTRAHRVVDAAPSVLSSTQTSPVRAVTPPSVSTTPSRINVVREPLSGTSIEDTWTWDEEGFRSWWSQYRARYEAYWARQRWARLAPAIARMHLLRSAWIDSMQSSGMFDPAMFDRMSDCGPFACGTGSTYVPSPSTTTARDASRSTARRTGMRWTLSNALTSLSIDTARAGRITYSLSSRVVASILLDTPRSDDAPAPTVTVRERECSNGAALELSWVTDRWTQQAVITLRDDATLADATIARTTIDASGARIVEFTNLTSAPHSWNVGGRELSVDPGGVLRVRSVEEPDASTSSERVNPA